MRSRWIVLAASAAAACGSVSNQPADARAVDAAVPDATPPACDLAKPFGTPVELKAVDTTANDWGAWLTPDQLTIYTVTDAPCCNQLYQATRASTQDPFGTPTALAALNLATAQTSQPTVTADGLTIYFTSEGRTDGLGGWDLYVSTRTSTAAAFPAPSPVAGLNTASNEEDPFITADGSTLYFVSDRDGTAGIYVATRSSAGVFGAATAVASVNSSDPEGKPILSPDQLTIYFARGNPPDIYVAHRATLSDGFGTATPITEVSTGGIDMPDGITTDGCTLLLASNGQPNATGGVDLFLATRPK